MATQNSNSAGSHPTGKRKSQRPKNGSALIMLAVSIFALATLGLGMLTIAWGQRHQATRYKNETAAMLAAEAGYEKAVYWMSQQQDMLSALQQSAAGADGSLNFPDAECIYEIGLHTFIGSRPVYRVQANGYSGIFKRVVDVYVIQGISGWDMGMCRVASGSTSTYKVHFANGEIVDIPVHINNLHDSPDKIDIYIMGSPQFVQLVTMGEKRYMEGAEVDKYGTVIDLFESGIYFAQPECRIMDEQCVQSKVDRFQDSTKEQFTFKPTAGAAVSRPNAAVQLEFFVDGGVGKVRITDNCTVRGFRQDFDNRTWDFRIKPGSGGTEYQRYDIYGYHLAPTGNTAVVYDIENAYVSQSFGGVESAPGGQIFVDGNVVIGGDSSSHNGNQVVMGKITVVATGNIWIADSTVVDGPHDGDGKPSEGNPNVLGLIAQGIIKVVDPGMTEYSYVDGTPEEPNGFKYIPIGRPDYPLAIEGDPNYHKRHLPDPMVLEAAMTVGGGGWGAENVARVPYGNRKEASGVQDFLIVRGTLVETIRGVVGLVGKDGYLKRYYFDERLLEGILPGDIWLRGKYIPAPAGWHDYRGSY